MQAADNTRVMFIKRLFSLTFMDFVKNFFT